MKKGILNRPSVTLCLSAGRLGPSNGREPQTRTYSTTPRLCDEKNQSEGVRWNYPYFYSFIQALLSQAYPNVQLRPLILLPLKHFRGSIRRAAAPCGQRLPGFVEVSESKVCKTKMHKSAYSRCNTNTSPFTSVLVTFTFLRDTLNEEKRGCSSAEIAPSG